MQVQFSKNRKKINLTKQKIEQQQKQNRRSEAKKANACKNKRQTKTKSCKFGRSPELRLIFLRTRKGH